MALPKPIRQRIALLAFATLFHRGIAGPVLSEIHFHPAGIPEDPGQEWVEIHNPGPAPVDLAGYALDKGVQFTFPALTVVPTGGYLVVAADLGKFQAAHPGFAGALVGGWTGQLANGGETVRLVDVASNAVDVVTYADEGDWALRGRGPGSALWNGHRGWEWFNEADGGGKTLELINPLFAKNCGQAWAVSPAVGGTPGAPNGAGQADIAPLIENVRHHPQIPRATDAIRVSANLSEDSLQPPTATLRWRLDGSPSFQSLPMADTDGDGDVEADIPPQANLAIVEFYLEATDGTRTRTWPAPARTSNPGVLPETFGQVCNALVQVDNTHDSSAAWVPGSQPVTRVILTAAERQELRAIGETDDSSDNQIDAAMNASVVTVDGLDVKTRHRCAIRNRGFSSRSGPPNNQYLGFPSDDPWNDRASLQFNCRSGHLQVLGANLFARAGIAEQGAVGAQLRINGLNPAVPGQGVGTFSSSTTYGGFARVEPMNGDWAARHFPLDPDGNIYRLDDHIYPAGDSRSGEFTFEGTNSSAYADTFIKKTNDLPADGADPYNYQDLIEASRVLSAPASGGNATQPAIPDSEYKARVAQVIDLDQWLTFFAVDALIGNIEGGLQNGRTDDFGLYRGLIDTRFRLIPHDFDSIFGFGGSPTTTRSIFSYDGEAPSNRTGDRLAGLTRLFNHPEITADYYAKLIHLMDTLFNRATLDPLIDEIMVPWGVPAGTITSVKSFIDARRANVLGQIPRAFSLTVTGNSADVDGMKASTTGSFTLAGTFDVARVRSIQVNGIPVPLTGANYRVNGVTPAGSWSHTLTPSNLIRPGVNLLTITFHEGPNGTGEVVQTYRQNVLYSTGSSTGVQANGQPLLNFLRVNAPATYVPGVPFLVEVEYQDASGAPDLTAWNRSATLTAGAGVTLTPAGGTGAAVVTLTNGRGSLLVQAGGGSGGSTPLFRYGTGGTGTTTVSGTGGSVWRSKTDFTSTTLATFTNTFGNTWTSEGFDDSSWVTRTTETGYGDGDENQTFAIVDYNGATTGTPRAPSYLFRNTFVIPSVAALASVTGEVLFDDAAVVYVNGTEVLRTAAMVGRSGLGAYADATATVEDGTAALNIPLGLLHNGTNTIAVAIHQHDNASSDVSFDLRLQANQPASNPGNFTLTATASGLSATHPMASDSSAPVVKSGVLAGSETWSGVIQVTGDVTVPVGATLTIAPGTHVLVDGTAFTLNAASISTGGADLIVNGSLQALGTPEAPISFTCSSPANRWGRIEFASGSQPSTLRHCLLSRAGHSPSVGGHIPNSGGSMLMLNGNTLVLEDCVLSDSTGKTLANTGAADLTLRRCHIARFTMGPEITGSSLLMEDTHITEMLAANRERGAQDDEDCIYIHDSNGRPVLIRRSVLAYCDDDVLDCLAGTVTVEDSIIRNGFDKGVSLLQNNITLRRCQIIDNDIGVSSKCQTGADETNPYLTRLENCTIVCENHPGNTSDGSIHSVGIHTRNKYGTVGMNVTYELVNCIIHAEEPVRNDYPTLDSTVFPQMFLTYTDTFDAGGANPTNAVPAGVGNLKLNPLFLNQAGKDFHLQAGSPCRDSGDPALTDADLSRSDMGALPYGTVLTGGNATNIVWSLAGSPYLVATNTVIAAGTTLTIEPGVNVYFNAGARLTVNGRLLAAGTGHARIRFSGVPGMNLTSDVDPIKNGTQTGAPKWGGIRVVDSLAQESVVRYADFVDAQGTDPQTAENYGSLGFIRSWGWADHLTFSGTHLRMLYGRNCKLTVTYCNFPDMFLYDSALGRIEIPTDFLASADNKMEPLKVEYPTTDTQLTGQTGSTGTFPNGLPRDGYWRVYFNDFHGNRGHQDVFDADSGRWNQPGQFVLDCRYNTFHGLSGDEHIDLGGDAYIAHNRFYSGSKDPWTVDTGYSNAISSGDKGSGTTIMVARNIFYDLDHAINCKINTATLFEHNTCVNFHQDWDYDHIAQQNVRCSAVNLYVPNDGNAAGDGAYMAYNVFYGNTPAPDDTVNPDPPGGFPRLISWPDQTTTGAKTSVIRVENNFIDDRILDTSLGVNHPGGLFAPAWGFGNVQGNPLLADVPGKDFSLLPESPAKGTAAGGLDYGATVSEWAYILGAPPAVTSATNLTLAIGGPGIVAYKWRLDGGPWSAPIQIGDGGLLPRTGPIVRQAQLVLAGITNGIHTLDVLGQDMAGNWQDNDPARVLEGAAQAAPTTISWTTDATLARVMIHEVAAHTADGIDWFELRNTGASTVDLGGWSISDSSANPFKHVFPAGTLVAPGGLLVLTSTNTAFGVDNDGDDLFLFEGGLLRDSIAFGPQPLGFTLGRVGLDEHWTLCAPTPGAANHAAVLGDPSALRITEWLASGDVRFRSDWFELFNGDVFPVSLVGVAITDNLPGNPAGSTFPPHSYIGPGAYQVFLADGGAGANHVGFSLDPIQEQLVLLSGGDIVHQVFFRSQTADVSQGQTATGAPVYFELPTGGLANGTAHPAYTNALAVLRGLRITEIMYNAPGGNSQDWIELRNVGANAFDLAGVAFVMGIDYTFATRILAPGQEVVLVADPVAFAGLYGAGGPVVGPYAGKLDNAGETLALRLAPPFDANVLYFSYDDGWYLTTDGQGRSLDLASASIRPNAYGDRDSWSASAAEGGTPGGMSISIPSDYAAWLAFHGTVDGADADTDGLTSLVEYGLGLNPRSSAPGQGADHKPQVLLDPQRRLDLTFLLPVNAAAPGGAGRGDVTYVVQGRDELDAGDWVDLATKSPTADWTGAATVSPGPAAGGFVPVTVQDVLGSDDRPRRYLRLTLQWTP